uniref:Uncharacterized protein n=1 Tax=Anguilla anguilla TaxID=7936 RepID=A0A0E9WH70_ANGAN
MRFFKYSISWKEYLTPIITALNVLILILKLHTKVRSTRGRTHRQVGFWENSCHRILV